ncbi:hypothetical protein [Streptomyces sp. AC555_RSS877]|uniref:hypothetical protein n=1 Tax=Streptomyces sp. AC555_RSS877 TaxID=2823688 RepID=UPI001C2717F5|nr:hypothetical protein [Streptomyces sp. AC555_RSS877]
MSAITVYYHAGDVRRVASEVAVSPTLKAPSQVPCCLAMLLVIVGMIALLFWPVVVDDGSGLPALVR